MTSAFFTNLRKRRLCGRQTRYRYTKWRAGNIIQTRVVTEANGCRIAAMLAANAELETVARLTAACRRDANKFADTIDIDGDERIARDHTLVDVLVEKHAGIVARQNQKGLREIVWGGGKKKGGVGGL